MNISFALPVSVSDWASALQAVTGISAFLVSILSLIYSRHALLLAKSAVEVEGSNSAIPHIEDFISLVKKAGQSILAKSLEKSKDFSIDYDIVYGEYHEIAIKFPALFGEFFAERVTKLIALDHQMWNHNGATKSARQALEQIEEQTRAAAMHEFSFCVVDIPNMFEQLAGKQKELIIHKARIRSK